MTKYCPKCKQEVSITNFYKRRSRKDGLQLWCISCKDIERREYRYGISGEKFADMMRFQNDECAICHIHISELKQRVLCVDHCHRSGEVRGLLCQRCNRLLGQANDSIDILKRSITYLINRGV